MLDDSLSDAVIQGLYSQQYHLLAGAGVSLDAKDRSGKENLVDAEQLRKSLCDLVRVSSSSPLWRVAGYLTKEQVAAHLTKPFFGCIPGPTAENIARLIWKSIFTLNIDDVLENAYARNTSRKQDAISVNYTKEFEIYRNPRELPIIHIHGFTRQPEDKYVFSMQEYARIQRSINPWVHLLSNLIVSEPFIIAGTRLFEPDLEFFFAHRESRSEVMARAPSLLIEPYPDAGTEKDCERLGLTLVRATIVDFITWLLEQHGHPPTPVELRQPKKAPRTVGAATQFSKTSFWNDFQFIYHEIAGPPVRVGHEPSPFMFGRMPSWDDIRSKVDVPLKSQLAIIDNSRKWLATDSKSGIICLTGLAGSGKSTSLKRAAYEVAERDFQVFHLKARDGIDLDSAKEFLKTIADPILLVVDSLAESLDEITVLVDEVARDKRILVLSAERQYRRPFLEDQAHDRIHYLDVEPWRTSELEVLIQNYVDMGLVANREALGSPTGYAPKLQRNTASEAVCRILNDFRPLRTIAKSLWSDTSTELRDAYLAVALAHYCNPRGLRRNVLAATYSASEISLLKQSTVPLQISENADTPEFIVPMNGTIASLLVEQVSNSEEEQLLKVFFQLCQAIAPFVTRSAIRQRTAEAKLAGRLFDADGVVERLLPNLGGRFYEMAAETWKWNSRYWEQRSLYTVRFNLQLALQYARHAVTVEDHPYPLTTLAKILFVSARQEGALNSEHFSEAISCMRRVMRKEREWGRGRTKVAYWVLLDGVGGFLEAGGVIKEGDLKIARIHLEEALTEYGAGSDIGARSIELLDSLGG
jgi:hypothetical protein